MSSFKNKPKQKSSYPGILSRAEELRKAPKFGKPYADKTKSFTAKLVQRYSGKRGN